jgi:hypothetical protein
VGGNGDAKKQGDKSDGFEYAWESKIAGANDQASGRKRGAEIAAQGLCNGSGSTSSINCSSGCSCCTNDEPYPSVRQRDAIPCQRGGMTFAIVVTVCRCLWRNSKLHTGPKVLLGAPWNAGRLRLNERRNNAA